MNNFKYYQHGTFSDLSIPIYGLYEPVLDCFLFLTDELDIANKLKYILSSRYSTHICQINLTTNYTTGIIDNGCCENWSLTNKSKVKAEHYLENLKMILGETLCPTQRKDTTWNIDTEKQWCLLCNHWLKFLKSRGAMVHDYSEIDEYLNDFLSIDTLGPAIAYNIDTAGILKLLYLGEDFEQTDLAIQRLINT